MSEALKIQVRTIHHGVYSMELSPGTDLLEFGSRVMQHGLVVPLGHYFPAREISALIRVFEPLATDDDDDE